MVPKKFAFMRFKDKIALITGGTRGIGAALGMRFLQEGAQIVVTYAADKDQAQKFQDELVGCRPATMTTNISTATA